MGKGAPQLSLFDAPAPEPKKRKRRRHPWETEDQCSARVVREEMQAPQCPHHGPAYICPACSPSGDTDGSGFLHRQVCQGRIPLRRCRGCQKLRTPGTWNHKDWFHCIVCIPLGSAAVPPDPF